jgi:membrane-associated phospholipid phosphatase
MTASRCRVARPATALLCLCAVSSAWADAQRRAGDVLSYALPAGVAAYELWQGDRQGALQFGEAFVVTLGATEVLKRTTHVDRPDRSNNESFPSGHASRAFSAATYVHRRHGFESAWPLYLAASYVGYTRVHADRHRWGDIVGSAAVSAAATWWLVDPKDSARVSVLPMVVPHGVAVTLNAAW